MSLFMATSGCTHSRGEQYGWVVERPAPVLAAGPAWGPAPIEPAVAHRAWNVSVDPDPPRRTPLHIPPRGHHEVMELLSRDKALAERNPLPARAREPETASKLVATQPVDVKPAAAVLNEPPGGSSAPRAAAPVGAATTVKPTTVPPAKAEVRIPADLLERVEMLLGMGNVQAARELLEPHARARHPEALLHLGRTYDPVALTALHLVSRGVADPERAIELYTQAIDAGSSPARARLDELRRAPPAAAASKS